MNSDAINYTICMFWRPCGRRPYAAKKETAKLDMSSGKLWLLFIYATSKQTTNVDILNGGRGPPA